MVNEFETDRTQQMKEAILETKATMNLQIETLKIQAELKKHEFDSLIEQGFTPEQALTIICRIQG